MDAPYTDPTTGIPQPPGGLMFALRCEVGVPGRWQPVEPHWQASGRPCRWGARGLEGVGSWWRGCGACPFSPGPSRAPRHRCRRTPRNPRPPLMPLQVAPVLMPQGNPQAAASLPGGYAHEPAGPSRPGSGVAGLLGQVAGMLPGEHAVKVQRGIKDVGHKLGNFLQKF
jgi:hypothetical protein